MKSVKIGDTRTSTVKLGPGYHRLLGMEEDTFIEADKSGIEVERLEELRYRYPAIKQDPEWQVVGYKVIGPDCDVPAETSIEVVKLSWWRRWFWQPRIPSARTVRT